MRRATTIAAAAAVVAAAAIAAALVVIAAGAGGDGGRTSGRATAGQAPEKRPAAGTPAAAPAARSERRRPRARRKGETIRVVDSQFGRILANGEGQAVYLFDREREGRSECYGACARAWPPVYAGGRPVAADGVRRRLLGTTRRRGGRRQVTYRGQPLYLYVSDRPGLVLCHDVFEFGGTWLVVRPDGTPAP